MKGLDRYLTQEPNSEYEDMIEMIYEHIPEEVYQVMEEVGFIDSDIELRWQDKLSERLVHIGYPCVHKDGTLRDNLTPEKAGKLMSRTFYVYLPKIKEILKL